MSEEAVIEKVEPEFVQDEQSRVQEEHEKDEPGDTNKETEAETVVQAEEAKEQRFISIDVEYTDEQGNKGTKRIAVPIIRESKERKYKIIKRKRTLYRPGASAKDPEEEVEEEYDACMLVEIVTKTVLIRDVVEGGNVEEREQDFIEEYLIGKERKYKYIKVERQNEDGKIEEVEELEVEPESIEGRPRRRRRKRKTYIKNIYDSEHELIGEGCEYEYTDEEEGRGGEEFSHIEEEEPKEPGLEEESVEEEIVLEDEEWKALDELMEEGEEESIGSVEEEEVIQEEIPKETSWEREQKKQKISFYKLMKLFLNEIKRRKHLMKELKLFCHITGVDVKSPGKEFEKDPQKFIDNEAAEVEALIKHLNTVYDEYKDEEERYKIEIDEVRTSTRKHIDEYKSLLLGLIHESDRSAMHNLGKGKDPIKKVEDTFKYEELLSKEYVKKAISTLNIEQIKYLLFTEIDQSDVPDEQKEVDSFEIDKMMKSLKHLENEALEDRSKLELVKKKFIKIVENVTCKRREADFIARKEEEFFKQKPLIEKDLDERENTYWKLKKYFRAWEKGYQKSLKDDYKQRFPAIYHNQKKVDVKGLLLPEMLKNLSRHCPKIVQRKKVLATGSTTTEEKHNLIK